MDTKPFIPPLLQPGRVTIPVGDKTRASIDRIRRPGETDNDVLHHALDAVEADNIVSIAELADRIRNNSKIDDFARSSLMALIREFKPGERIIPDKANLLIASAESTTLMRKWVGSEVRLGRAIGTQAHKLHHAITSKSIVLTVNILADQTGIEAAEQGYGRYWDAIFEGLREAHTFVVEHDWAAAFSGAGDFSAGEIVPPYPVMMFEFHINGRRVVTLFDTSESQPFMIPCVNLDDQWFCVWLYDVDLSAGTCSVGERTPSGSHEFRYRFLPMANAMVRSIRAACICLEAEVAETEVVRAPHRLNHQRERKGKLPIRDYHVVRLASRRRVASLPADPNAEKTRKRCHFRRGHWRHYQSHKTWIKWMLVGDPDLGFVDKEYRL